MKGIYSIRFHNQSRSPIDRSRYTKQLHICNHMMSKAKSDYYTHFITTNSENPRQMWKSVNTILHQQKLKALPEHSSLDTLCSSFSKYFTDKIARIRSNFVINDDYIFPEPPLSEKTLQSFTPATTNEVLIIIKKYPNKSCDLDPFPTLLLKSCIDQLIFPVTTIINLSMQSGVVPQVFKQALVNPLIKKLTLCKNDLRNYRGISNLSFLSKILEKVVANRLYEHIYNHHLSNDLQSAYKRFHSTETALLKIHNDIVDNMDNGKVTALTLLDLSAAFDTIDHSILLQCLHRYFGISGPALRWFKSFLSDRYQSINISGTLSSPQHLPFGVPQGSVLGPVLFSFYTTSLSQVIANRNLSHHLYADDTQVYISLSQSNGQESLSTLSDCLTDILSWMESSKLKLNPDKTDLIIIGTKQQRNKVINHFPVKLLGSDTFPSDTVRNLGVVFDSDFNFRQHIAQVCKSCFYHIRDHRRIRRHISISTAKTISKTKALISSRLDYCNSLLNNIAKRDLAKLQRVQNCLARVVLRAPRFSPSLPPLKQLHWLPVSLIELILSCSLLHIVLYLHNNHPTWLVSCIFQILPKTKLNLGKRAFSVAAPRLGSGMNSLSL